MKRLLFVVAMLFAMPLISLAQEAPRVEIFGGYSYLRTDDYNQQVVGLTTDRDLNGFGASVTVNFNTWFGLTADGSGHYGGNNQSTTGLSTDINTYFFTAGPRFAYRKYDRVTPFGHVLIGGVRQDIDLTQTGVGTVSLQDTSFALVVGGGVDLNVTDYLAVRLFQADYILTRFNDDTQNNFRAGAGLVLKLGSQ